MFSSEIKPVTWVYWWWGSVHFSGLDRLRDKLGVSQFSVDHFWNGRSLQEPPISSQSCCRTKPSSLGETVLVRDVTESSVVAQHHGASSCWQRRGWSRLNGANYWKPEPESSDWARVSPSDETKGPTLCGSFSEPASSLTGHTPVLPLDCVRKLEYLLNSNPSESSCCEQTVPNTAAPSFKLFVGHVFMWYDVNQTFICVMVNFKQLLKNE